MQNCEPSPQAPKRAELGYIIRMFPQTSETFIANEILELERLGLPMRIFSYRQPSERVRHDCVRLIQTPVEYLVDPLWRNPQSLLHASSNVARLYPKSYRKAVRYALDHSLRQRKAIYLARLLQAAYLARVLANSGVGHIHAHFARGATEVATLVSMLTNIPFSFSAHAGDIYTAKQDNLRERIAAARFVVTCTRANQDYLQALVKQDQRHKIRLSYHGVNLEKFDSHVEVRPEGPPLILSAGRLVEKKGFRYLLDACRILKEKGHEFRCLIVGEGPGRAELERAVAALGLDGVVDLPGSCSQEELLTLYRQSMAFVLSCVVGRNGDRDGIPNVLLEAMAVGRPVISTPISGIPEVIRDGHNGLLTPERDAQALASAIAAVLEDAALRERLSSNARSTVVERFDSIRNVGVFASLFHDMGIRESKRELPVTRRV